MNYPERISISGLSIYDSVRENNILFLPVAELEAVLRQGLIGLVLDYPLRTRSKILKSKICEIMGYPVPKSFKKTQPRFPGQDFDTYVQKSNNLQIWNEKITASRRYVIIKVNEKSVVVAVRVITGELLARMDSTGVLTRKYQAKSKKPVERSELVTPYDSYGLLERIHNYAKGNAGERFAHFLPISALYEKLLSLIGTSLVNPGLDQERNRGGALHAAVCRILGVSVISDNGSCPDIVEQLLEIKLQTSPTIDLGLTSPNDDGFFGNMPGIRHCEVRYAVFYGTCEGDIVHIRQLVLCSGNDFFNYFQRFEGKVVNAKLQIPLPSNFFD